MIEIETYEKEIFGREIERWDDGTLNIKHDNIKNKLKIHKLINKT
jgi:hypothetical protein